MSLVTDPSTGETLAEVPATGPAEVGTAFDRARDGLAAWQELLDRYVRRRRTVVRDVILAQADRNRSRMRLREPGARREALAELRRTAADPVAARRYLRRTSMIDGLRRAAAVS